MGSDLFVIGISWRTAPVALREKLAFTDDELPAALQELTASSHIDEALVLSTCNRVEVYGATARSVPAAVVAEATSEARSFLSTSRGVAAEKLAENIYEHTEGGAVEHVFRVASALDSLVLGEAQILGQLKAAYGVALGVGATGSVLGRCLERAFGVAKRVRSETGVSRGAANVSSVAVELARRVFVDLSGKTVLVIGAGKMSALAARHLHSAGAGTILVTNRSSTKAEILANEIDGVPRPWDQLDSLLTIADVVISSTGSRQPVLTPPLLKTTMKARRYRSIVIIDIAVPRDADPRIGRFDGVYLFDIDDLRRVVASNLEERAREAELAERIIAGEVEQFDKWLRSQRVVPTIRSLREHFIQVARAEVDRTLKALDGDHNPKEREKAIRRLGDVIVNKLLHAPLTALKAGDNEETEALVEATNRLFPLDSDRDNGEDEHAAARGEPARTRKRA
ncbi:MAG: glutamyl-tRNA reductase [Proteobacteria bacterium]|nr:glutamyl-tRNA reductase [Pseudomonadota bacterium]